MVAKGTRLIWTDEKLHELGENLVNHCGREDVFHITDWLGYQKKSAAWYYDLKIQYPLLADYHDRAKEVLGNKIVALAFKNGNNWAIQTFIPKYLKDVDNYIDSKRQKELVMIEKAKGLNEQTTSEKADSIIDAADKITEEKDDSSKL